MTDDLHPDRSADEAQEIYNSIPSIRERAMQRRQLANAGTGHGSIHDAASAVVVQPHQTEHEVTTGDHEHLYPHDVGGQMFSLQRHSHISDNGHPPYRPRGSRS